MQPLIDRVLAALDARLSPNRDPPLALALSGGGDSVALLHLAAHWCALRGRSLLALTVDHGLNQDSGSWSAFARDAALGVGAQWRGLSWEGPKPSTSLPAAARRARHALLAEAARQAGAGVILMAHTADDVAESEWMKAQGATLGVLRDWSPSPVWPQGRGVMLLRPLLTTSRAELRKFLQFKGATWIEDPANTDLRFMRSRARLALDEGTRVIAPREETYGLGPTCEDKDSWSGLLTLPRATSHRTLAAALLSVSGQFAPPRGARLAALWTHLASAHQVTATLVGARLQTFGDTLIITREPGRGGLPDMPLSPNIPAVWDGRFEITAPGAGWNVGALKGRMARLAPPDQGIVKRLSASARPGLPVLFRDDDPRPVLAWRFAKARCLVTGRFLAAMGGIGHEDQLTHSSGETPPADLFLNCRGG